MLLPHYSFINDSLGDVLLDLSARFIVNCPPADLSTAERLFFQIEEAHWFYEDFARVDNPRLPSMKLSTFVDRLFTACPFLHEYQSDPLGALSTFQSYKSLIPVRGAIILNSAMDKVLMVKGWRSSSSWGFPKGKINKDEPDSVCAAREVFEETGFDISPYLVEEDFLEVTRQGKNIKLFVIRGVPESTHFEPQTRKEISKISWHNLNKLPQFSKRTNTTANYYMAAPFMGGLKKYINRCKGLATSLTSTETKALQNVLGSQGEFYNDESAAKNLLAMLKPSTSDTSDRAVLLNLIKGDHASTDLESAQQVLGLYEGQMASSTSVPSVTPTKIVIPESYAAVDQATSSSSAPPLPPNSMLQNLVSSRQNKQQGSNLLSILNGTGPASSGLPASPPATLQANNKLLDLLHSKPATQESTTTGSSAARSEPLAAPNKPGANKAEPDRAGSAQLMSLLSQPVDAAPKPTEKLTSNNLMALLNPKSKKPQRPDDLQAPENKGTGEAPVDLSGSDQVRAQETVVPPPASTQPGTIALMDLLNKPSKQSPRVANLGEPIPIAEVEADSALQQVEADAGPVHLQKLTNDGSNYPSEQSLLDYLKNVTAR